MGNGLWRLGKARPAHTELHLGTGYLDDLLQVAPGLLQGLHGEPGVGVGGHAEALDLAVQLGQLVEVGLGGAERGAEGVVGLAEGLDLLQRVAAHGVRQVLLGVLKPAVEGRGLLGKGQEQVLHLGREARGSGESLGRRSFRKNYKHVKRKQKPKDISPTSPVPTSAVLPSSQGLFYAPSSSGLLENLHCFLKAISIVCSERSQPPPLHEAHSSPSPYAFCFC